MRHDGIETYTILVGLTNNWRDDVSSDEGDLNYGTALSECDCVSPINVYCH